MNTAQTTAYEIAVQKAEELERTGGSFASRLAVCFFHADGTNGRRLIEAFPELLGDEHSEVLAIKNVPVVTTTVTETLTKEEILIFLNDQLDILVENKVDECANNWFSNELVLPKYCDIASAANQWMEDHVGDLVNDSLANATLTIRL